MAMTSYSLKDVERFTERRMKSMSDSIYYNAYCVGEEDFIDWESEDAISREMIKDDVRDHFTMLTPTQLRRIDAFIEGLH